ncbi:sulfotransferase 2A8-like [Glandiceps talaboti]
MAFQQNRLNKEVEMTLSAKLLYKGVYLPYFFDEQKLKCDVLSQFSWRENDVVVVGYPKSGTTWLLYLLQNIQDFGLMSLGNNTGQEALFLDWLIVNPDLVSGSYGQLATEFQAGRLHIESPRLIRSHLPFTLFPWKQARDKNVKIIYTARNPKDVCVSMYHYYQKFNYGKMALEWNKTVEEFIKGKSVFGPWLHHVTQWKEVGIEDNVLHMTYEDMKEDMSNAIRKCGNFLQVDLSDQDIQRIKMACSVEGMRESIHKCIIVDKGAFDGDAKQFVRKGIVGDWKNHFKVAQNEMFDKEIVGRLEEAGIFLKYELP